MTTGYNSILRADGFKNTPFPKYNEKEELSLKFHGLPSIMTYLAEIYSSVINNSGRSTHHVYGDRGGRRTGRTPLGEILFIMRYGRWDFPRAPRRMRHPRVRTQEVTEECNIKGHKIEGSLPPRYHTYLCTTTAHEMTWGTHELQREMITEPQQRGITHAVWLAPQI